MQDLFQTPKDDVTGKLTQLLLLFALFFVLVWCVATIDAQSRIWVVSVVDLFFLIIAFIAAALSLAVPKEKVLQIYGGGGIKAAAIGTFAACVAWFILSVFPSLVGNSIIADSLDWSTDLGMATFLNYLFNAYIQPFAEEILRFVFVPSIAILIAQLARTRNLPINQMGATIISILFVVNPFFSSLHFFADYSSLQSAGLSGSEITNELAARFVTRYTFGVIYSFGNLFTGSAMFSIVEHKLHNTYLWFASNGIPDVPWWWILIDIGFYLLLAGIMAAGFYKLARRG